MKIVKRIGVFETNSSSSHSFSIKKNEGLLKGKYLVQIVSAEEKLIWFLSMLNNAEEVYNWQRNVIYRQEFIGWEEERITKDINDGLYTIQEIGYNSIQEYLNEVKDYQTEAREEMIALKGLLMDFYCKQKGVTLEQLNFALLEKVKYVPENSDKLRHRLRKGETPPKREGYARYHCLRYFDEGCLDDCSCGFETYEEMSGNFPSVSNKEKINEYIAWFFSENCIVVAGEE